MLKQNRSMAEMMIPGKIRKRGCSSSASSSSSVLHTNRFKRAILVGKRGGSSTPVPTWRLLGSRSPASAVLRALESPRYPPSQSGGAAAGGKGRQAPVSARKLAATLWEMNEIPSPSVKEMKIQGDSRLKKELRAKEKLSRSVRSGSFPPHLSDPSHSPVSERLDRSGTGSRHRRTPSVSHKPRLTEHHVAPMDSLSNASLMEIETRSRAQTPASSTVGGKTRLKDASNALTTSKELLKIINRMWGPEDRPSSSMSLISALHTELERARLQVNQLIQEQRSDQNEICYLMKCFAEEKAVWKSKQQEIVEAAIESVAGELEVERKLRRRFESLNKKLGRELAETKATLLKMAKELESEKRAREIIEQVCDELARDGEDKSEIEKQRKFSTKVCEEAEEEKEMMQLTDMLREERAQKKLSEVKYQLEEKNAAVDKLRSQLEAFLGSKQVKEKGRNSTNLNDDQIVAYLSRSHFGSHHNEDKEDDGGEVDNGIECEEESAESDLHSIELNTDNNHNKSYKFAYTSEGRFDLRRYPIEEAVKGRRSTSGKVSRRSTSLQRSISDGVEWGIQAEKLQNSKDGIDWESFYELEKQAQAKGYADEMQGYKSVKGLRDQILADSRPGSSRGYASPTRQFSQLNTFNEKPPIGQGNGLKSRLGEARGECQNVRKAKR